MFLKMVGIWALVSMLYRRVIPATPLAINALWIFFVILCVGLVLNVWYFTTYSGGTPAAPVLKNDDASMAWQQLMAVLTGTPSEVHPSRQGYGNFLALLTLGGTPAIDGLLCFNTLAILCTIVLTGAAAVAMAAINSNEGSTNGSYPGAVAAAAMICIGGVCYFLAAGVILIKDAVCCLAMAAVVYALYGRGRTIVAAVLIVLAMGICCMVRPQMAVFAAMATAFAYPYMSRDRRIYATAIVLVACGYYLLGSIMGYQQAPIDVADGTTNFDITVGNTRRLAAYSAVSAEYASLSIGGKLLRLPFSLAVQYLTPLPWAFGRDVVFGPSQAYAHLALPWYAVGGVLLYTLFFKFKAMPGAVRASLLAGVLATMATAFITGGTVSRYCLPWLPMMVPAAAWLIASGSWRSKSFKYWSIAYSAIIILAAATAIVVLAASNGGHTWEVV